ncbi:MAG: diguanylate cyclase [Arenimonas sp.]|nr:diguanylate cyclase [Arenimonas sp.]
MQVNRGNCTRRLAIPLILVSLLMAPVVAMATPAAQAKPVVVAKPATAAERADTIERHPLELRALIEPESVLRELSTAIINARLEGDQRLVALLYLAQANACRVVADWDCQREAGINARAAAVEANVPHLAVRGLIAESRARLAMQDYTRGSRLLGDAELMLKADPQAELLADVMLAYSSMSFALGKHPLAAEYAQRGLAVLGEDEGLTMRARLLRNRARAEAQLDQVEAANVSLLQATRIAQQLNDPKLEAELYLEGARVARIVGDQATQRSNGERVLAMAGQLRNSQLAGLGHEVLGLAAADARDGAAATRELRAAQQSFRMLELQSDELRVTRELVTVLLRFDPGGPDLAPLFQRYLVLDNAIAQNERLQAADDFDARLKYAERENELTRLQGEQALAQEREAALASANRQGRVLIALGAATLLTLATFFVMQRRNHAKLQRVLAQLREKELKYRTLADNASDLVIRMREDGTRLYVSPSAQEMLGTDPTQMLLQSWEQVHPDDLPAMKQAIARLAGEGGSTTILHRARHAQGHYVWVEALARRIVGPDASVEIVFAGRDVSTRVRAEQALESAQARLRAVTDNIPALIAHIDSQERYSFLNAHGHRLFGLPDHDAIGKTVREVRGEAIYSEVKEHIAAALRGEQVTFEGQSTLGGRSYSYQTSYVPDFGADGQRNGFFAFTFDITQLKDAESRLEQMARFDSLTGLANRRYFDERLAATIARCRRQGAPLAVLYLDIDRFKPINDAHGHEAGDQVLRVFAQRLKSCVREGDLAARIGGDEFALLAEGAAGPGDAESIAAKVIAMMAEPIELPGTALAVTASVGIAFSRRSVTADRLLVTADAALYQAKAAGRNTWRLSQID